ncbi:aspartate kinase [Streptomyces sp. NPDC096176]|uniref:aspartate kinase n=1 Tax=Streptomyces sp. NPDC096176 TaxID=3366079 RepID=UPI0037F14153
MSGGDMTAPAGEVPSEVVVQKYGGSSLATTEQVHAVARRIASVARSGRRVVAVVSAQGRTTDHLIRQAEALTPAAAGRELDQLLATGETASAALMAMAVHRTGVCATALSGAQSGILATGPHGSGIIVAIDTERMWRLLESGRVVVVAGFQGVTADGDAITLGRGGSDTTAVAVAAELRARHCEIYSDVAGVLTADPRIVPHARLMPDIGIDVMAEMAFAGAKVVHSRAVELADLYGVDIHVGHSAAAQAGTRIHKRDGEDMLEAKAAVMAVVDDQDIVRVTLHTTQTREDPALAVFRILAQQTVPADMTTVVERPGGGRTIGLTVSPSHVPLVREALTGSEVPLRMEVDDEIAKVSIVGKGLLSRPEYAARLLASLTASGITARCLSASQLRVSVTVPSGETRRAVGVLHSEFGLDAVTDSASLRLARRT